MMTGSFFLMAVLVAAMLLLEARDADRRAYGAAKTAGSILFVVVGIALVRDVPDAPWARPMFLSALALGLVGDVALIPRGHKSVFLVGLVAFLLGHLAYVPAFIARGLDPTATVVAAVVVLVPVALTLRWLRPRVQGRMWIAVVAYVLVISTMLCTAIGAVAAGTHQAQGVTPALAVAAFAFWCSDLCVARERFVKHGLMNKLLGLPLYFFAQLGMIAGYQ